MRRKMFTKIISLNAAVALLWIAICAGAPFAFVKQSPASPFVDASTLIDDKLLDAIIKVESSNDPSAYNRYTKARGLTQIRAIAWLDLKKHYGDKYRKLCYRKDIYNPAVAREAGKDYLRILEKYLKAKGIPLTYHNLLTAYVWGPDNLLKYGFRGAPRSGKAYVAKVMNHL